MGALDFVSELHENILEYFQRELIVVNDQCTHALDSTSARLIKTLAIGLGGAVVFITQARLLRCIGLLFK